MNASLNFLREEILKAKQDLKVDCQPDYVTSEKSGIAFLSVPDFTYPSADQAAVDGLKAYLQRDLPVNSQQNNCEDN